MATESTIALRRTGMSPKAEIGHPATSIRPGRIRGSPGMFRHVSRTPALQNKAQGLPLELRELVCRWPVIPVKNPGLSEQKRRKAILDNGGKRWASGEVIQNRMPVTGRPTEADTQASYKELQTATKRGFSVSSQRMWLRRLANEGQQVTPAWLAAATDPA
jgi:hypothetical protein